jgi:hypothetical protein
MKMFSQCAARKVRYLLEMRRKHEKGASSADPASNAFPTHPVTDIQFHAGRARFPRENTAAVTHIVSVLSITTPPLSTNSVVISELLALGQRYYPYIS